MRLLVTGAGGFIGSRLAETLVCDGHEVTGTWHHNKNRIPAAPAGNSEFVKLDLCDDGSVERLFSEKQFDAVIHCAARLVSGRNEGELATIVRDNVLAHARLIDAVVGSGCGLFMNCSSISVYGGKGAPEGGYRESDTAPVSPYGWSKRTGEQLLDIAVEQQDGLQAISFRLAGVHGVGRSTGALHGMTEAALAGEPIRVSEPKSRFRWLFIDDLITACRLALAERTPEKHAIINLASSDEFTLGELAERIKATADSSSALELGQSSAPRNEVMNIDAARDLLGYRPQSLDAALDSYIAASRHVE